MRFLDGAIQFQTIENGHEFNCRNGELWMKPILSHDISTRSSNYRISLFPKKKKKRRETEDGSWLVGAELEDDGIDYP